MKKVLHITSWYPNKWDDLEGIFVKEQFDVFSEVTESHLLNVQVRSGKKLFEYRHLTYSDNEEGYYLLTSLKSTKVIEVLTTLLLLWALFKTPYKKYDLLHFHIAYPLLTYYSWWKKIVRTPVLISEHWSAYHFNFYMPLSTKKLNRMKYIFRQGLPVITVSKALFTDLQKFAGSVNFPSAVIPNVIDQKCFFYEEQHNKNTTPVFFVVNNWRKIKNPFPMLEGFANLAAAKVSFHLNIGGYGELLEEMKAYTQENNFENNVSFLGKMNKKEIAKALATSDAYLFSSEYETFSVVCAQALCCGVPLIGPKIPAILEYADEASFLTLGENSADEWYVKLTELASNLAYYDRKAIALKADAYLSNDSIKKQYKVLINAWF